MHHVSSKCYIYLCYLEEPIRSRRGSVNSILDQPVFPKMGDPVFPKMGDPVFPKMGDPGNSSRRGSISSRRSSISSRIDPAENK